MQRADLVLQRVVALDEFAAALVVGFALGREHEGTLGAVDQLDPQPRSSWLTTWLAPDCEMPFSSAAREKLLQPTTSQKTFKDFNCMGGHRLMKDSNRIQTQDLNRT